MVVPLVKVQDSGFELITIFGIDCILKGYMYMYLIGVHTVRAYRPPKRREERACKLCVGQTSNGLNLALYAC